MRTRLKREEGRRRGKRYEGGGGKRGNYTSRKVESRSNVREKDITEMGKRRERLRGENTKEEIERGRRIDLRGEGCEGGGERGKGSREGFRVIKRGKRVVSRNRG